MTCDRCGRQHNVVWFAPSDIWNYVMREGDRGKPDEFSFCCPICFMQLAEERGIITTGWLVAPEQKSGRGCCQRFQWSAPPLDDGLFLVEEQCSLAQNTKEKDEG